MEDKEGCVLIGKGVSITGNITLSGTIHIYGDVNGEVVAQEIHVGDTGKINGDIKSDANSNTFFKISILSSLSTNLAFSRKR